MKEQNCKPGSSSFLEQFLRAVRSAISQAVVLILPQQNLTHILYVVPFFQSRGGRKGEREGGSRKKKLYVNVAVVQPLSCVQLSLWPNELQYTRLSCPLVYSGVCSNSCSLSQGCHLTISFSAPHPSPPALSLSQHQGLFQWVSSSK